MAKETIEVTTVKPDGTRTTKTVELELDDDFRNGPEFEPDFWCQCEGKYESDYYEDEFDADGALISKHHYRCKHCGKVTQIG